MNIRQRRLKTLIHKVLKEELQKGNLPSSREFIQRIRDHIHSKKIEKPSLEVRGVRKNSIAISDDVNKLIDQSYEDLKVLYESLIGKYNVALRNFNKFDVEKGKLDYELNKLENYLKELILLYGESGFLTSVYDVFDDISKVDTQKSTAEINIKTHEASLLFSKNTSHKVTLDGAIAVFSLSSKTKKDAILTKTIGVPMSGLNDNIDEVWAEVVYLKESKGLVEGSYEIHLPEERYCNNIELDPHVGRGVEVKIEYSYDGSNWRDLPYYDDFRKIEDVVTFSFTHVHMRKVRVRFRKTEADHTNISNEDNSSLMYGYLLGIKKIGFFQTGYSVEGELYSKPLSPITMQGKPFTISQVSLHVDEDVPHGTQLDYYVAIPPSRPEDEPEWKRISPVNREAPRYDQIIDFKNITRSPAETFKVDPDISEIEYRLESLYANGINFYKLGELSGKQIIDESEKLYVGKNSWNVKKINAPSYPPGHMPSLADWEISSQLEESFLIIQEGKAGTLLEKTPITQPRNYMFTLGVFSRKSEQTVSATPNSTDPIAIYMNGEKIFEGIPTPSTRVNYLFKPGWNEITVLAYISNTVGAATGTSIDLQFDPREYGSYSYAKARSLEKVSLFELRYNVKSNDRSKYAILETNDKYVIVLNHIIPGLEFDFYADYVDGEPKDEILFRADMKRDPGVTELSPKLKSYRLRFS